MTTTGFVRHGIAAAILMLVIAPAARAQTPPESGNARAPDLRPAKLAAGIGVGGTSLTGGSAVVPSVEVTLNRFVILEGEATFWRGSQSVAFFGSQGSGHFFIPQHGFSLGGNLIVRAARDRFVVFAGGGPGFARRTMFSEGENAVTGQLVAGVDLRLTQRLMAFGALRKQFSLPPYTAGVAGLKTTLLRQQVPGPSRPTAVSTQTVQPAIGRDVEVKAMSGATRRGALVSLSASEVVLRQRDGTVTLPLTEVRVIRRVTHTVRNATILGAAGGFLIGLAASGGCFEGDYAFACDGGIFAAGIGAGMMAGISAAMNAASASSRILYAAPSTSARVSVGPLVSSRGAGVDVQVGW